MKPDLILIMPVYNESDCIEKVVRSWHGQLVTMISKGLIPTFKMIIINDGSTDNTPNIIARLISQGLEIDLVNKKNGGHGDALYVGYRKAVEIGANWVFQTDSDDQFEPKDIEKLWLKRGRSRFILGCRKNRNDPSTRIIVTKILQFVNLIVSGVYIKDANIPFRLIDGEYLKELFNKLPPNLFAPNIFLSLMAAHDKCDLLNIPVIHKERQTGEVSIAKWKLFKVCRRSLYEILKFRFMQQQIKT